MDNQDIDLLITDFSMPEMDGRRLIQRIRNSSNLKQIPIIIVSGVVGPKEIADVLEAGATAFLPKPLKVKDIKEYINRYLKLGGDE